VERWIEGNGSFAAKSTDNWALGASERITLKIHTTWAPNRNRSQAPICQVACNRQTVPSWTMQLLDAKKNGTRASNQSASSGTYTESPFINNSGRSVNKLSRAHMITPPTVHCMGDPRSPRSVKSLFVEVSRTWLAAKNDPWWADTILNIQLMPTLSPSEFSLLLSGRSTSCIFLFPNSRSMPPENSNFIFIFDLKQTNVRVGEDTLRYNSIYIDDCVILSRETSVLESSLRR